MQTAQNQQSHGRARKYGKQVGKLILITMVTSSQNIATGEAPRAIAPFHFFDYFNFFGYYHEITFFLCHQTKFHQSTTLNILESHELNESGDSKGSGERGEPGKSHGSGESGKRGESGERGELG